MSAARTGSIFKSLVLGQGTWIHRHPHAVLRIIRCCSFYPVEPYNAKRIKLDDQSVLLPGKERIRASRLAEDPYKYIGLIPGSPHIKTVYDVLDHGKKLSNDGPCIGSKSPKTGKYEWQKYSEVILKSKYFGSALLHLGLKPGTETLVGVFASNREEFLLSLYGCAGYSMVLVPLYESMGFESIKFIIKQGNFSFIVVNNNKNASHILNIASENLSLKTLVIMDEPSTEVTEEAKRKGLNLLSYTQFEEIGKKNLKNLVLPDIDDLFCIPYTSGTTGTPKGVLLTHRNLMSCVSSLVIGYGEAGKYGGTIISYLPPAHIYEIVNEVASLYFARRIAFYSGDIKKLMDEVKFLRPTILPLVPRLMNAIYAKAQENVKGSTFKSLMLKLALSRKAKLLERGIVTNKSIWDKIVFKKFQDVFGGRLHMIITTSAPISAEIMKFFRCAAGCHIFEAYGQTEVLACTMTLPNECGGGNKDTSHILSSCM